MTAQVFLDMARRGKHKAIANTAAASSLGQMMLRLGQRLNYPIVHIVRRQSIVEFLRGMGARYVFDSTDPDFDTQLRESFQRLGVTLAFDAIAGDMTERLLNALPSEGRVVLYGQLSGSPCVVDPASVIFGRRVIQGFVLTEWVTSASLLKLLKIAYTIQRQLPTTFQTSVRARVSLDETITAVRTYATEPVEGKVLIIP
jgi:NADPH:quinone reductase-like Zn-dependent oxidoreductase